MSPKSSSSFLRQQQEFVADLLREMVNFLHLPSPCQCLPLIYVGQSKMESSAPKLNWSGGKKNPAWERICFVGCVFPRLSLCVFQPAHDGEMKGCSNWGQLSFLLTVCKGFFYKLSGHLHLVKQLHISPSRGRVFFQNITKKMRCVRRDEGNFQRGLHDEIWHLSLL